MTHPPYAFRLILALAAILLPTLAGLGTWTPAQAVLHGEALLITLDPVVDVTDVYAFVFQPDADVSPIGALTMIPEPIDPATLGDSSMLLRLGDDIHEPLTGPVTMSIDLTQLSLRSTVPITVTNPDGTTEQWDIELGVSPTTPSAGTLDLFPQSAADGVFRIELPRYLQAVFSRVGDDEVRTVDYATQPAGAVQLGANGRFSLMCPLDRLAIPGMTTPFCLGHDLNAGGVLPVTLTDINDLSNPRFSTRVEPTPAFEPTNNSASLSPFGNKTMTEGSQAGGTLSASDPDGDNLAFSATGLPGFCTLTDNGNGTAVFVCSPAVGDAGVYTITITVNDDGSPSLSDSETFTLTVLGTNQPPELDPIGDMSTTAGNQLLRTITASLNCLPGAGDVGDYTITFTVTDDGSPPLSDSETVTLTV